MPQSGDLRRIVPEITRLVEQHEAEPSADHDTERDPKQEIVGLGDRHRRFAAPELGPGHQAAPVEPAEHDAGHVGEAIPADGDRPNFDRHGIDHRVGEHEKLHEALPGRF